MTKIFLKLRQKNGTVKWYEKSYSDNLKPEKRMDYHYYNSKLPITYSYYWPIYSTHNKTYSAHQINATENNSIVICEARYGLDYPKRYEPPDERSYIGNAGLPGCGLIDSIFAVPEKKLIQLGWKQLNPGTKILDIYEVPPKDEGLAEFHAECDRILKRNQIRKKEYEKRLMEKEKKKETKPKPIEKTKPKKKWYDFLLFWRYL